MPGIVGSFREGFVSNPVERKLVSKHPSAFLFRFGTRQTIGPIGRELGTKVKVQEIIMEHKQNPVYILNRSRSGIPDSIAKSV